MVYKDINCTHVTRPIPGIPFTGLKGLIDMQKKHNITERALYLPEANEGEVKLCTQASMQLCAQYPGTLPVLPLLPPAFGDESYTLDYLRQLIDKYKVFFRISPAKQATAFTSWQYGQMLRILAETNTPLLINLEDVDLRDAGRVKEEYPELILVLTNTTQWLNRQYTAFCQAFGRVYIDTCNCIEYYGLETCVSLIGADRMLFGTNMPYKEPYDNIITLLYGRISDEEKQLIAYGNYDRLAGRRGV